jgi:hypothetical protein
VKIFTNLTLSAILGERGRGIDVMVIKPISLTLLAPLIPSGFSKREFAL